MSEKIVAPMAGKILHVFVNVGDKVEEDDQLLSIEAMKMENPILATTERMVREIQIKEGDGVGADQLLLIID